MEFCSLARFRSSSPFVGKMALITDGAGEKMKLWMWCSLCMCALRGKCLNINTFALTLCLLLRCWFFIEKESESSYWEAETFIFWITKQKRAQKVVSSNFRTSFSCRFHYCTLLTALKMKGLVRWRFVQHQIGFTGIWSK